MLLCVFVPLVPCGRTHAEGAQHAVMTTSLFCWQPNGSVSDGNQAILALRFNIFFTRFVFKVKIMCIS